MATALAALFITGNSSKFAETVAMLDEIYNATPDLNSIRLELVQRRIDNLPEVQDLDVAVVARHKALAAFAIVGEPVIVEDTGLALAAWNRLPGSLIKFFLSEVGQDGILKMLQPFSDRRAIAQTVFAYADWAGCVTGTGTVHGWATERVRGDAGFGWDGVFVPAPDRSVEAAVAPTHLPTYGAMDHTLKNQISMRRQALSELLTVLATRDSRTCA